MFERNERDFSIYYNEDLNNFSISVGTWNNSNQSFCDVIFYLTLNEDIIKDKTNFFKELNKYNDLFIDNKENIIKDIKENKLNTLNSVLNEYQINDILNEFEYNEREEGHLKEEENYNFDYAKCEKYIEENYINEIIETINKAQNIKELYEELQKIKTEIKEDIYNNFFDYVFTETIGV